jgi:hypothetical protein
MLKNLFSKEMVMNALLLGVTAVVIIALHENMPNGFKIKALSKEA